jgi:phage tail-like protein
MDVNGTRLHLLLGRDDWGRCVDAQGMALESRWQSNSLSEAPAWDSHRSELTLQPLLLRFATEPTVGADPALKRRGAARDRYGNWYWIDESSQKLRVTSVGDGRTTVFWPTAHACPKPASGAFTPIAALSPPTAIAMAGVVITEDHYLLVGTLDPAGLLVFDLHAGGPPRHLQWPSEIAFEPFDMAAAKGGGAFILDRTNKRYWALDRHLGVIARDQDLQPLAPPLPGNFTNVPTAPPPVPRGEVVRFPLGIRLDAASSIAAQDPVAIEGLADGTVLILDRGIPTQILRYRYGQLLASTTLSMGVLLEPTPQPFGADFALVSSADGMARLFVTSVDGEQAFAFRFEANESTLIAEPLPEYWPMRLFGGKALVGTPGGAYYDFDQSFVPLVEQARPRFARETTFITPAFDGRAPGCIWHRLFLEGSIPPQASVQIESRSNDVLAALALMPWSPEPQPRWRKSGSELPFLQDNNQSCATFELLFQHAKGQYLQIRVRLTGDGRTSPHLRAMRIYYPRFSYLERYLPAVYQEDQTSASFLDRFLANIEGLFTGVEDKMATVRALFDPRTAPTEALEWLAGWFGVALDPAWDPTRRRLFLRHAIEFFAARGTVRGIEMALRLMLEDCVDETIFTDQASKRPMSIRIVERFLTRGAPPALYGEPDNLSGIRVVDSTPFAGTTRRWQPSDGRETLRAAWRQRLVEAGRDANGAEYPLMAPEDKELWQQFSSATLGFVPAAGAAEQSAWRDFLARRYRSILALNNAHFSTWSGFDKVILPTVLPSDGNPLVDWHQFQTRVLGIRRTAHRFTVLLPVPKHEAFAVSLHQTRRALAQRIIELEKPAHTRFDVKFYWAMFRVGEARLGFDTLLDVGSRAPELMPNMVLGEGFLGESRLSLTPPERASERTLVGEHIVHRRPHQSAENRS